MPEVVTVSEKLSVQPPKWYMPTTVVALIWNLIGLMMFGMFMTLDQQGMDAAGWNAEQQELFKSTPVWVNAAFAVGVICGVLGSIALMLRKQVAVLLLNFSMVGVLAQCTWVYFLSDSLKLMGVGVTPFTITISVGLVALAMHSLKKRWIC